MPDFYTHKYTTTETLYGIVILREGYYLCGRLYEPKKYSRTQEYEMLEEDTKSFVSEVTFQM